MQQECEIAEERLTSNDYYLEMAKSLDESATGTEARLYLAAKCHLAVINEDLGQAMEIKGNLPPRPVPVGLDDQSYLEVEEAIRQHNQVDERIRNAKGERSAMATLVDTHLQQLRTRVFNNIENEVTKLWQEADVRDDTETGPRRIPKVNTKIATLPKLTKRKAQGEAGVIRWLEKFVKETEMYINENDDRVVYLLNSNYVEPAVWDGVLELHKEDEAYTTRV